MGTKHLVIQKPRLHDDGNQLVIDYSLSLSHGGPNC